MIFFKASLSAISLQKNVGVGLDIHAKNFLTCLQDKTPEKLNASIEVGRNVALVAQMGNIAYRTGERVYWDATKNQFTSKAANKLMVPNYHNGYKLPNY